MPTVKQYREQIKVLEEQARRLAIVLEGPGDEEGEPKTEEGMTRTTAWKTGYPLWYAQAREVMKFLLPDRLEEFDMYYLADPKRKDMDLVNYSIQDWLLSRVTVYIRQYGEINIIKWKFLAQMQLLEAAEMKLDDVVMNFKKLTLASLFDSEIDGAKELLTNGFLRPAGVVARVVLEKHLKDICETHKVKVNKKNKSKPPTLSDYNGALKEAKVYDIAQWRKISALADITNKCCHGHGPEPTEEEVQDLIDGADKVIKNVF